MAINKSDISFDPKKFVFKNVNKSYDCYNCKLVKRAIKNNPSATLRKLRISKVDCECSCEREINVFKKTITGRPGKIVVARIRLVDCGGFMETHSNIYMPSLMNKGLGLYLYSKAADWCHKSGLKLRSSYSPSDLALRVWESKRLRKKYSLRKVRDYQSHMNFRWEIKPKSSRV